MFSSFLHFLFPPLCLSCGEKCATKILCPNCWLLCELPDPVGRCRHCFEEIDEMGGLCLTCRKNRHLSMPRAYVFDPESPARLLDLEEIEAMAGFALYQWIQLEWPMPNAIVPMPDSIPVASAFARFLDLPLIQALSKQNEYREERLEEGQIILLFDISNSLPNLQKAILSLSASFPKRIFLLSLLPDVNTDF